MEGNASNSGNPRGKFGLSQNMIIAILGAAATILAAVIPILWNRSNAAAVSPTPTPMVQAMETATATLTLIPPTDTPTITFTPTEAPPTATSTPIMGFYNVILAIDREGLVPSTTFSTNQPVYVVFRINDPTDLGRVRATWYAVDVPGIFSNSVVYTADYTILVSRGSVVAGGNGVWKPGDYKVELYLNGQLSYTQEFQVTK